MIKWLQNASLFWETWNTINFFADISMSTKYETSNTFKEQSYKNFNRLMSVGPHCGRVTYQGCSNTDGKTEVARRKRYRLYPRLRGLCWRPSHGDDLWRDAIGRRHGVRHIDDMDDFGTRVLDSNHRRLSVGHDSHLARHSCHGNDRGRCRRRLVLHIHHGRHRPPRCARATQMCGCPRGTTAIINFQC